MTLHSLGHLYSGWGLYQERLVEAIVKLEASQLVLRSAPHTWSVGMIAAHIIAARVWWFHARMGEGSTDLAPMEHWDSVAQPARSAEELVNGLERTWQMIQGALAKWTPADLEQIFPARSEDRTVRTRQWIVWHVLEHDIHHGGEISSVLGAHGLSAVALE